MPKAASRSVVRRRNLSNNILAVGCTLNHPCSHCAKSHKECFVDLCTSHCAHCVSLSRVCDSVEMNSDCSCCGLRQLQTDVLTGHGRINSHNWIVLDTRI